MTDQFTSEQYNRIEDELLDGEELLWAGRPTPFRAMGSSSLISAGVALGMLLLVQGIIFGSRSMTFSATTSMPMMGPPPAFFTLFTLIILLVFAVVLLSPLWQLLNAYKTIYAITDRRILILDGVLSQTTTTYSADDIERIERRSYGNGRGDIIFRHETRAHRYRSSAGFRRTRYYTQPIGLFGIPNVKEVERLMLVTFTDDDTLAPKPKRKHDDLIEDTFDDFYMDDYEDELAGIPPGEDPQV